MLSEAPYMRVHNCARYHKMPLDAVVPLGLALTWYEGYTPDCTKSSARLLQNTGQGDSFRTTDDAVPHWPRLDVCRPRLARNLNSRRLLCSEIHWREDSPAQPLVERDGLRFCAVQFYRCHHVVVHSFQSYTGQLHRP